MSLVCKLIEMNKNYFDCQIFDSLKYLSDYFNVDFPVNGQANVNYNWKVFAYHFLCVDAIKLVDLFTAEDYLRSALKKLSDHLQQHDNATLRYPEVTVITSSNISSETGEILKRVCEKRGRGNKIIPFKGNVGQELRRVESALTVMKFISPFYYDFVTSLIKSIVLVGGNNHFGVQFDSSLKTMGCIVISVSDNDRLNSESQYIKSLIHGASRMHLFLEQARDPLVNNTDIKLHVVPCRKDRRPLSGIYHANYAMGNFVAYFSSSVKTKMHNDIYHDELFLAQAMKEYNETYSIIERYGDLTARGRQIFDEMKVKVDNR